MPDDPFDWSAHSGDSDFPEPFKFKTKNDTIEGMITGLRTTTFGGTSDPVPELTLETDGGEYSVAASQVILRTKLAELAPQIGDRVRITYTGDGESKKAGLSPPKIFEIGIRRNAVPVPATPSALPENEPLDEVI